METLVVILSVILLVLIGIWAFLYLSIVFHELELAEKWSNIFDRNNRWRF